MAEYQLTIVGSGPQLEALREMAAGSKNIHFIPHVKNIYIDSVYMKHDVLILPSLSETWGLVVEEALYYGLPIVGSSSIGCIEDLVYAYNSGMSFDPKSEISLCAAIKNIIAGYEEYSNSARSIDFYDRDVRQVESYFSVLDDS
jgi:glycosyltransferase involved in cell wall biosynthesis